MGDDKKTNDKVKRFSLSKEAKDQIANLDRLQHDLFLQSEGLNHSINIVLARERGRLGINDEKTPEGFQRRINFDQERYEIVIIDQEIPKAEKKA